MKSKISIIAESVTQLIQKYGIQHVAMEDIFFAKNETSAIGVAKVIGAVTYAAYRQGIGISMFTPLQIKTAITGYGRAEKKQVQEMCRLLLRKTFLPDICESHLQKASAA